MSPVPSLGTAPRVLVIGLDGATFDVLMPAMEQGWMPALRQAMQQMALAECRSTTPCLTPTAWTTFLTGTDVARHGVLDFRAFDHRRGSLELAHAGRIRCPTNFQAVRQAFGDDATVSLNLPMTWPPRAGEGLIVGGLESPSAEAALAPFPAFAAALAQRGIELSLDPIWRRVPRTPAELAHCVAATCADFRARAQAAQLADGCSDWRLMIVQFQALDALQHRAWHWLPTRVEHGNVGGEIEPEAGSSTARRELRLAWEALDRAIAALLELADRRGAAVMIVSDHGFGPFHGKIALPELLAARGLLRLAGLSGRWKQFQQHVTLCARKIAWRSRHRSSTASLARSGSGTLPADMRRSVALPLHGDLGCAIYLNTTARFGRQAPLTTAKARAQAADETRGALERASFPHDGTPLFETILDATVLLGDDPLAHGWPDLIAIPAAGWHVRTKLSPGAAGPTLTDRELTGTHRQQGVMLLQGPQLSAASHPDGLGQVDLRDAAPILLRWLGIPIPSTMTGNFPSAGTPPLSPSKATPPSLVEPTLAAAAAPSAPDPRVEQRLRDLGYLD